MTGTQQQPQRVLVTAGAAGIGRAIAGLFRDAGARVFICDVDAGALEKTLSEEADLAGGMLCDVSAPAEVDALFAAAGHALDGLDVLVNNAGIAGPTAPVEAVEEADWDRTLAVNISGQFYCAKRAVPLLRANDGRGGAMVNLSSAAGRFGFPMRSPYAASKWAVVGFTKSLAMELGPDNIRVNAILPGVVEGERIDRVIGAKAQALNIDFDAMRERMVENVSMRCMVTPRDIAEMALFLCSPAGARISGQALAVDGNVEVLR